MKNLSINLIGKKLYPVDNSQQCNLITGEETFLAGTAYGDLPQLVTIISEPYKLKVTLWGKESEWEFVTVLYNGEPHICGNHFQEEYNEADYISHQEGH